MRTTSYRPATTCSEVWLRLANRFPAIYTRPPAKVCGRAREALCSVEVRLGGGIKAAAAFRDWLAEADTSADFETAISAFERKLIRDDE